jgi:hypothetical protein
MPKTKSVMVTRKYVDFIKDKLPFSDQDYWWEIDESKLKQKDWLPPSIVPIKRDKEVESHDEDTKLHPKLAKKFKKLKLKYTSVEVKKSIEEDEKSLQDVKKLEEHLKEDISKAKKKLKHQE